MANTRNVSQLQTKVSIGKDKLVEIGTNFGLSEEDLRVLFLLFSELSGWSEPSNGSPGQDPLNYTKIDTKTISDTLGYKNKKIKKCIRNLEEAGLIEQGSNDKITNGWRFTF